MSTEYNTKNTCTEKVVFKNPYFFKNSKIDQIWPEKWPKILLILKMLLFIIEHNTHSQIL